MDGTIEKYFPSSIVRRQVRFAEICNDTGVFAKVFERKLPTIELRIDLILAKFYADNFESASITAKAGKRAWLRLVLSGQIDEATVIGLIFQANKLGSQKLDIE
ncbi:hypothetical protein KBC31_02205 [Candidatus Saccharibacteria bacterium]|jgi:hypothetical protein|nr:hypothetical protein [Candidatus Saccharibacteria bacterium]